MVVQVVTVENFVRVESDRMFAAIGGDTEGINRWKHYREPSPLDHQNVIRLNRDTLYSASVIDAREGFTLTLPETGGRYMSAMVINQDHYIPTVWHGAGEHSMSRDDAGSDYVLIGIRTLVDPADADDVAAVNALQDQVAVRAPSAVPFTTTPVDSASLDETRNALLTLAKGLPDYARAFGARGDVDPIRHLIGSASAWGGLPETEAFYINVEPGLPVGDYELNVTDVPVDAFWSISVYNADGYFEPNERGINNLNSVTAVKNADGSTTVRFGGGDAPNTIPITEGWNYLVRLYRPRAEVRDGTWTFPTI
ncbi:DUF1214 domain-containing protein [Microbacterium aurugineum]|uniref:DUF1214 domain-containing protein n=1 Tax=Microbacterium aurugineum TaxID=2851642 RepID=UPI0020BE3C82|nr:DUF1214 domain-containing protein [Microbacterium aurugineum]MCK8476048.1 DUF1214 domain-containing protein [Microbacterium aurugineum]